MDSTVVTHSVGGSDEEARTEIDGLIAQMHLMRREIHDHHERTERSRQRTLAMLDSIKTQLGAMSQKR